MAKLNPRYLKILGIIILLIPVLVFCLFAFGEIVGGDISGLSHLVQALPLALLAFFCWKYPRIGGLVTMLVGIFLTVAYPFIVQGSPVSSVISTDLMLFTPPIVAGFLVYLSTKITVKN